MKDNMSATHSGVQVEIQGFAFGGAAFGKLSDMASSGDIALAIINMVYETAAMLGIFAARSKNLTDIVLTGNLTSIPQAKPIFENLNRIFGMNFVIPDHAQFATAIGAALA